MSLNRELDRRVDRLDRILQRILYMFLLHQLSLFMAKAQADKALSEAYAELMAWFKRKYKTPDNYNHEASRILKVMDTIRRDFYGVLEKRGEEKQQTERALKLRVYLIALGFIFSLQHSATIELSLTLGVPWIRWNNVIIPPWPCQTCIELASVLYRPHEVPQRPHPSCKCWISLEWR